MTENDGKILETFIQCNICHNWISMFTIVKSLDREALIRLRKIINKTITEYVLDES